MKGAKMLAAVVLMMSACGGPAWTGTYTGTTRRLLACESGVTGGTEDQVTWTITQQDKSNLAVSVAGGGSCNPIAAVIDSKAPDTAQMQRKFCSPVPDAFGGTATESIADGRVTQDDLGNLTMVMALNVLFRDPGYVDETCGELLTATLLRQAN